MASIETRTRAGKIVHLVRYVDPDGKDRAPSFKTLREAKVFRAKIVTELHKGTYINRANGMTVAEYAWEYAKGRPHRPTSAEHTRSVLANHVQGTKLGGMKLVDVKPSDLQRWATERVTPDEDGHAPLAVSTARKTLSLLRSIFASAVEDKLIAMSPVTKRVRLPKVDKPRLSVLTVDEVKRLRLAMAGVRV